MIVNYHSSHKLTDGGAECRFGCIYRAQDANIHTQNHKIRMRRWAKRAERILIQREIQNQLIEDWFWFDSDIDDAHQDRALDLYDECIRLDEDYEDEIRSEQIDSRDIDDTLDYEHWLRESEMRDEYYEEMN